MNGSVRHFSNLFFFSSYLLNLLQLHFGVNISKQRGKNHNKTALCSRPHLTVSCRLSYIINHCQRQSDVDLPTTPVRLCQVWQITETSSSQALSFRVFNKKHLRNSFRQRAAGWLSMSPLVVPLVCSGSLQVLWILGFTVPGH